MTAKTAFEFYTSSQLVEITSQKAGDLKEFREILKGIDGSSIFYHVHHAFREHQFAPGVYTNDFAHWVENEIGEHVLAERLANINIKDYTKLEALRDKIVEILDGYLSGNPAGGTIPAKHGFYTPGTHVQIFPWEHTQEEKFPDYALLFAWSFMNEVLKKRVDYTAKGGKFIVPLPNVKIVP